jgi:predicted RNA-binding Zn ribbon-like protein
VNHVDHQLHADPATDFVNTAWTDHRGSGQHYELLADVGGRKRFLARWGYRLHAAAQTDVNGLAAARRARTALRSVLEAWAAGEVIPRKRVAQLNDIMRSVRPRPELNLMGNVPQLRFEPARRDWAWVVSEVVAAAARLMATGDPRRLKSCANPNCTWLFYDDSPNVSRRWCDPAACGNLLKSAPTARGGRESVARGSRGPMTLSRPSW